MRTCLLILFLLLLSASSSLALQPEEIRMSFNSSDGEWLALSLRDADNRFDLETDRRQDGRLFTVRIDLNGDEAPELFVRTLCGNGGCEYPIFDGKTKQYIGSIFGSAIWLLKLTSHSMPMIQSFSHVGAERANIATYEWNGSGYLITAAREIVGDAAEALYSSLKNAPKWKPGVARP